MKNNSTKIVLIVLAVLAVLVLVLLVSSGGCGAQGGGAAGTAPAASTSASVSQPAQTQPPAQTQQPARTQQPAQAQTQQPTAADQEQRVAEASAALDAALAQDSMPVGANERSASASASVPTTATIYGDIENRGFADTQVVADFDINGSYSGAVELDKSSTEKHPSYMFSYESPSNVIWFIYVNDGSYSAVPMAIAGNAPSKEIILSETGVIVQYDGAKNAYSDFTLDQIAPAVGVKVSRIDVATLDSYTPDQLGKM